MKKHSAEYARISNVSDAAYLMMIRIQADTNSEYISGKGGRFSELGLFDKNFVKNIRKRATLGKYFEVFLLDSLKTTFSVKKI